MMSAFTPTRQILEPAPAVRPDNLSAAVLHSLSRPIRGRILLGPIVSFILAALSFGILPLIAWPKRFGRFVVAEQQQFWHLVEWLRIRTGDEEAAKLRASVRDTGPSPTLWIVPTLALIVLAVNFLPWLTLPGTTFNQILATTYGYPGEHVFAGYRMHQWMMWSHLFKVWTLCLSVAYASHWLHVRQHAENVNRFLRRINLILAKQHLPPVPLYGVGIGFRPLWLLAGIVGLSSGALWAIPAAFAGAVHQRYCRQTSTRIRGELARRVDALLRRQSPPIDVPVPNGFRVVCRNKLCGKSLPGGATFCSRCGTRIPPAYAVA